jgi:hypothetical protein
MVISTFNATKAYKRKRGASPPRLISLTYWVTQVHFSDRPSHYVTPSRHAVFILRSTKLWCASPSHRHFCTKIMTPADVVQILIPFTKTLQMRLRERPQDRFSICQNMREI